MGMFFSENQNSQELNLLNLYLDNCQILNQPIYCKKKLNGKRHRQTDIVFQNKFHKPV